MKKLNKFFVEVYEFISGFTFLFISLPFFAAIHLMEWKGKFISKYRILSTFSLLLFLLLYQAIFFCKIISLSFNLKPIYREFEDEYRTFKRKTGNE